MRRIARKIVESMCTRQDVLELDTLAMETLIDELTKEINELSPESILYQYLLDITNNN